MAVRDIRIEELGPQGDGIHEGPRGRVYVEGAVPGDRVRVRLFRDEKGISRGQLQEVLEPSPLRRSAPCPHYDPCGGCTLQHLSEPAYREWKIRVVREAFHKQGLRPKRWRKALFLGDGNRRRATFAARRRGNEVSLGYYRRRSRQTVDIVRCLVADPELLRLRDAIRPYLTSLLPDGGSADIFLQKVEEAADMVFTGPIGNRGTPDRRLRELLARMAAEIGAARISWRPREKENAEILVNRGPVTASFGDLRVNLPPGAFLQPTPEGEQALVRAVLEALPKRGRFADLFSGCGTFSGPLLSRGSVDAFEAVPGAVSALAQAAAGRSLRAFRRDLFRNPLRREELNRYDAVVFDPPRAGCAEQAAALASAKVRTLVGVSCNPATFARDARLLREGGYWLQSLQVVDQFVWSHHMEIVGVFTKAATPRRNR